MFLGRSSYIEYFHHRPIFRGEIRQFRQFPFVDTNWGGQISPVPFFSFFSTEYYILIFSSSLTN